MNPWWLLPPGRLRSAWWVCIATVLLWIDYLTGPKAEYPVLYVIPVTVAAWYSGKRAAIALAIMFPVVHAVLMIAIWHFDGSLAMLTAATLFRGTLVIAIALWTARLSEHERELRRRVQTLEGLLPICAFCKRIRNDAGEWERLERYIAARSDARFSHAFCPACWNQHYSELGAPPESAGSPVTAPR